MRSDYSDLEKRAKEKEDENWAFRSFLKFYDEMSDEQLDALVFKTTDKVWSAVDCTKCGRCCEELKPTLSDKDQEKLADYLKMSVLQLRENYLDVDDSHDEPEWHIKGTPCPFLENNKCTVYDARPQNCCDYPYLHKPDFTHRTWGMVERTFTCPVVYRVMEELKKKMDFDPNDLYW